MSTPPRRVLIIHADEARRRELRALLAGEEVTEVASRQQAAPLLAELAPCLVVSQPADFKRLLRDLERHAPGATRAVLCPPNEAQRQELVDVAAQGYDFVTVDDRELEDLRGLLQARGSERQAPLVPLTATFRLGPARFSCGVAELANDGLGLRVPEGLAVERVVPGTRLEEASVCSGERLVLEPRSWLVRSVRPADRGAPAHLGVSFEPPRAEERRAVRVADEVKVRALLRRAAQRGLHFDVQRSDGTLRRRFASAHTDRTGARLVLSEPSRAHLFTVGQIVRLSFELGGEHFEGLVAVVKAGAGEVTLLQPELLLKRHRRGSLRARAAEGLVASIRFRSPLTGDAPSRPLLDLHPWGASFASEPEECLPAGLVLEDVALEVRGRSLACSAVVQVTSVSGEGSSSRRTGVRRCGVALRGMSAEAQQVLRDALIATVAPGVVDAGDVEFAQVWRMFADEGAVFPDYPPGDPQSVALVAAAQARLGRGERGLSKALLKRGSDGDFQGHSAGLRIYSRTWLALHLLVRAGYHRQAHISQTLVNLTFDYGEALEDVEYMRGLWRNKNRWAARVYGATTARLLRPGLSTLVSYTPMRRPTALPIEPAEGAPRARPAEPAEAAALLRHLRTFMDPVRLRADDYCEGELHLETLGRRYREAGLERSRRFGVVEGPDGPRGWVAIEEMSRGLFWADMYTSFRLTLAEPNAPDADQVRHALAEYAVATLAARGHAVAECHAAAADLSALEACGFTSLGQVMDFCAHRSMTREMTAQLLAVFERLSARGPADVEAEVRP